MPPDPYGSDDNPLYQDYLAGDPKRPKIDRWRHYFDIYHRHFQEFRGQKPTVLEIGVQKGGSLRLWKNYFGRGARIFGIDVDPACANKAADFKVFIGDQADKAFLKSVIAETGPPDIIIDDGGHTMRQQLNSMEALYMRMRVPGVYLVEDTHTAYWGGQFDDDPRGRNFMRTAAAQVARLHDWTGVAKNLSRLMTPPDKRPEPLPASEFCKTTDSITFYDSIVVFTRRQRPEPWRDDR